MQKRLQKCISDTGYASRRTAEALIAAGRVTVNGATASLGMSADPERDEIAVDGRRLTEPAERIYLMLNKPRGYVTTLSDERGRRSVAELVRDAGRRLYPVGRLDMASEGLLIMTDDGEAANALMHPAHEVKKLYSVTVAGEVSAAQLERMRSARSVQGKPIRPPEIELLRSDGRESVLRFVIREGRNREIRRICEGASLRVTRLVRLAEGELRLGSLRPGKWRELDERERAYILSLRRK